MKHYAYLALFFLLALSSSLRANKLEDIQAVVQANAQFYEALNAMFQGNAKPMSQVWSHASDVVYMGPDDSYVVGWNNVRQHWEKQASMKLGGEVKFTEARVLFGDELAVVHNYEVGKNFNNEGKEVSVKIRATNVYRKINGQWKMISHHTDNLPELMKQP